MIVGVGFGGVLLTVTVDVLALAGLGWIIAVHQPVVVAVGVQRVSGAGRLRVRPPVGAGLVGAQVVGGCRQTYLEPVGKHIAVGIVVQRIGLRAVTEAVAVGVLYAIPYPIIVGVRVAWVGGGRRVRIEGEMTSHQVGAGPLRDC